MKKLTVLVAILAWVAFAACGQQEAAQDDDHGAAATEATQDNHGPADGHDADPAAATGETMTLTGTLGCGHCTFNIGDGCAAAMQTVDGTIYILDGVDEHSEAFQKRMSEAPVEVVGVVKEGDPKHVEVAELKL